MTDKKVYNKIVNPLKKLIKNENRKNKITAKITKIDNKILSLSLTGPSRFEKNTQIRINNSKAKIITAKNKNITIQLSDNHKFHTNQEVNLQDVQKAIITGKLDKIKSQIEENQLNYQNRQTLQLLTDRIETGFNQNRYHNPKLNKAQQKAVQNALSAEKFHLIQGPPGTGKTHTIVEIVKQLHKNNKKILITAHTHIAVDNVLEKLGSINDDQILRIGQKNRINKKLRKYLPENQIKKTAEYRQVIEKEHLIKQLKEKQNIKTTFKPEIQDDESFISRILRKLTGSSAAITTCVNYEDDIYEIECEINKIKESLNTALVENASVIASTILSASGFLLENVEFDYVIVDEAGQVPLYLALIVLMKTDKFILIGDNKQLEPIFNSSTSSLFLNRSIFSTLIRKYPDNFTFLNIQYRMNQKISDIASSLYYNSQIQTFPAVQSQHINVKRSTLINNDPVTVIDTSNTGFYEDTTSSGCCNKKEAELILYIVEKLIKNNIKSSDIGVISAYRKQKLLLQKMFKKRDLNVEADTIYRFQGREKDVIILSFCKSSKGSLSRFQSKFLSNKNQLNVSITRSCRKLFIIGDFSFLSSARNILDLLGKVDESSIIHLEDLI